MLGWEILLEVSTQYEESEVKKMIEVTCAPSDLKTYDVIEHVLVKEGLLSKQEAESMVIYPPIDLKNYLFFEHPDHLTKKEPLNFVLMNKAPVIPNVEMINEFYRLLKPGWYVVMAIDMQSNESSRFSSTRPLTSEIISIFKAISKEYAPILNEISRRIPNSIAKRSTPALSARIMYESALSRSGFRNLNFRILGDYCILYAQKN